MQTSPWEADCCGTLAEVSVVRNAVVTVHFEWLLEIVAKAQGRCQPRVQYILVDRVTGQTIDEDVGAVGSGGGHAEGEEWFDCEELGAAGGTTPFVFGCSGAPAAPPDECVAPTSSVAARRRGRRKHRSPQNELFAGFGAGVAAAALVSGNGGGTVKEPDCYRFRLADALPRSRGPAGGGVRGAAQVVHGRQQENCVFKNSKVCADVVEEVKKVDGSASEVDFVTADIVSGISRVFGDPPGRHGSCVGGMFSWSV